MRFIRESLLINPRRLWLRYSITMALLLALIISAQFANRTATTETAYSSELINMAGRQRMLSQRILLLAAQYQVGGDPAVLDMMREELDLFVQSHAHLTHTDFLTPELAEFYGLNPGQPGLETGIREFVGLAEAVLIGPADGASAVDAMDALLAFDGDGLLAGLNTATKLFEDAANARIDALKQTQSTARKIAVMVLLLQTFYVFLPAQISINRTLNGLESRQKEIAAKNDALARTAEDLHFAANHDGLTGLANRTRMIEALQTRLDRGNLNERRLCAMQLDLDHFKLVNDTYGHPAGDELLRVVAERLMDTIRSRDLAARMGGDEFVVLAEYRGHDDYSVAVGFAESLIARLSEPVPFGDTTLSVGVSIGIAYAEETASDVDTILSRADQALYEAKDLGRGTVRLYEPGLPVGDVEASDGALKDEEADQVAQDLPFWPDIDARRA